MPEGNGRCQASTRGWYDTFVAIKMGRDQAIKRVTDSDHLCLLMGDSPDIFELEAPNQHCLESINTKAQ